MHKKLIFYDVVGAIVDTYSIEPEYFIKNPHLLHVKILYCLPKKSSPLVTTILKRDDIVLV